MFWFQIQHHNADLRPLLKCLICSRPHDQPAFASEFTSPRTLLHRWTVPVALVGVIAIVGGTFLAKRRAWARWLVLAWLDEMRRVRRIAYRVRQLQHLYRSFATDGKARWQNDTLRQPLRIAIEKLLIY
jgi:hypothetical protein